MNKLSKSTLRKLIIQELRGIVDEDALIPAPSLGEPHYLDLDGPAISIHQLGIEGDKECEICGGEHDAAYHDEEEGGCGASHDVDVDWENPEHGQFRGNIEDLDPQSAFGAGYAMGQSGDFDDVESEQDDNLPLIGYLKESCGCEGDPENLINNMGDFSNLSATNITPDEAFQAGKEQHHEKTSYMAKPQLAKIAKYAAILHDMISEDEQLQDWQESHIAQLSDDIGEVYHSLEYKKKY